jgi:hypothetical protein
MDKVSLKAWGKERMIFSADIECSKDRISEAEISLGGQADQAARARGLSLRRAVGKGSQIKVKYE